MKKDKLVSYAKLQEKYPNEYIARKDTKVFVHAKTISLLFKRIAQKQLDPKDLTIGFVPSKRLCIYVSKVPA